MLFLSPISKQKPPFGLEKCPKLVSEWLHDIYLDGAFLQLTLNTPIFVIRITEHEILNLIINLQLPVYDMTKAFLLKNDILPGDSAWNHLLSSFCAGLCACLASSPVDVIRTRLMDQRVIIPDRKVKKVNSKYAQQTIYKSSWECGLTTIRNEGFLALYKGFVASFMRMGPWNIIFFLTYEKLKQVSASSSSSTAF